MADPKVQATTTQPDNPLLNARYVTEVCALVLAICAVGALITRWFTARRKEDAEAHRSVHALQDREIADLQHDIRNARQSIASLEHQRMGDVQRMVAMETNLTNIKEGQVRIEHAVDKMAADLGNRIDGWAEQFSASIREVRNVSTK